MILYYRVERDASYDLDLDTVAWSVIADNPSLKDGRLIYMWLDNMSLYLERIGFTDAECLNEHQYNAVGEEVVNRLETYISIISN